MPPTPTESTDRTNDDAPRLRRVLGLPLLTFYGLGTIVGAGIYVLVGKVAATAGVHTPLAFALAAITAGLTGVAYAELSARFPRSAGEAVYTQAAFDRNWLTLAVGWAVVLMGTVSAAAIVRGFVGYVELFVDSPDWLIVVTTVLALGAIACLGIGQSVGIAAAITVIEVLGLVFVIAVASPALAQLPERLAQADAAGALLQPHTWSGILLGAVLAFYAFIGFEDMVNVAEEVQSPARTLPNAIFLAIVLSTVLYVLVSLVAISALSLDALAGSDAPMADIVASRGYDPRFSIGVISLLAVTNGALIQIIMASRVIYGLSQTGGAPAVLGRIERRFATPVLATAVITIVVLALGLWFPIEELARVTSLFTLGVFIVVNASLLRIRAAARHDPDTALPRYPLAFPVLGALSAGGMLLWQVASWLR